jgi:rRNA maturation RNase YbeY
MITVQLEYDNMEKPDIDENWVRSVCENILMDSNQDEASITFIFSNDDKLRKLKKEYFGEDVFTDTISFNLEEESDPIEGEVYISLERVSENAHTFQQDFITEYKRVIIHGCLHLLGYNDELPEDKTKMTELEETYLSHNIKVNQA